jgi:hypothetical protein
VLAANFGKLFTDMSDISPEMVNKLARLLRRTTDKKGAKKAEIAPEVKEMIDGLDILDPYYKIEQE